MIAALAILVIAGAAAWHLYAARPTERTDDSESPEALPLPVTDELEEPARAA